MTVPADPPKLRLIEGGSVRNIEAEAALLGGLMCDNAMIDRIADLVRPEDFYEPLHERLYTVILREHSLGHVANPVTIKSYFADDPALQALGGFGYLGKLTGGGGAVLMVMSCAQQVAKMGKRRRLIEGLRQAAELATDLAASNEDVIALADSAIAPDEDRASGVIQMSAHDAFWEMVEESRNETPGVTASALPSFNDAMGPARPHHLDIVAGRPGMGKTALAMSYSLSAAQDGHGVLFVSLEMSRTELMQRAAADLLYEGNGRGIPYSNIRDNKLSDYAKDRMREIGTDLRSLPFHIVDAGSLTIGRLNMIVRRYKRRMEAKGVPLRLVVVDYLQLVRPDQRTSSPVEAVSEVSRGLKAIAKTHDVAVLALAQLNRSVEQREDKRPKLSDLRDSGQIEQDADAVVFLYRAAYYLRMAGPGQDQERWQSALDACEHEIEFICAKRRNGEAKTTTGQFHGVFQAVRN